MLLILVEVSVKVACRSTTGRHRLQHRYFHQNKLHGDGSVAAVTISYNDTDCSTELLILVEVSVNVAYRSMTATDCSHRAGRSIFESSFPVHDSHRLKAQNYLHATYSGGSICVSGLSVHTVTDCSHTVQLIVEEVL